MANYKYFYVIKIQYLGFRLHGWQKQPNVKTVQQLIEKTLKFILGTDIKFRILGSSRTDAMVSSNESAFELFLYDKIVDLDQFFINLNRNLPSDIRALAIEEVNAEFNIIQHNKIKEYLYLFSSGEKNHPFAAPFMTHIFEPLDIEKMKEGAQLFIGTHNFKNYAYKPSESTTFVRTIYSSEIILNTLFKANFFPDTSYLFKVEGNGFLRHQIRLMMGTLLNLGQGKIELKDIKDSLNPELPKKEIAFVAPASGLILNKVTFE